MTRERAALKSAIARLMANADGPHETVKPEVDALLLGFIDVFERLIDCLDAQGRDMARNNAALDDLNRASKGIEAAMVANNQALASALASVEVDGGGQKSPAPDPETGGST